LAETAPTSSIQANSKPLLNLVVNARDAMPLVDN